MDPVISATRASSPFPTLDPFLYCVFHEDRYPAGDALMQAPSVGNGADFNPSAPYRMYHGTRIPGFPQHPHRGFETVTASLEGIVDHTDSAGNAGRYGNGDVQWMTAGRGMVHSEMFPLLNFDRPNTCRFFQIWLNLPARSKMVEPSFVMHWASEIPRVSSADGRTKVTVWAGTLGNARGGAPPVNSWAADPANDVAIWFVEMLPGGAVTLPPAQPYSNRAIYLVEGDAVRVGHHLLQNNMMAQLHAGLPAPLQNVGATKAGVLLLQGRPINEPVAKHGPFVMNTEAEVQQAYADYQRTRFGGWPWPKDDVVFPREKGRFAMVRGMEIYPPR